jgi:hypothetical protein
MTRPSDSSSSRSKISKIDERGWWITCGGKEGGKGEGEGIEGRGRGE